MADLTENEKRDYQRWLLPQGDVGFSPERNKTIIEGTIKKYNKYRAEKRKKQFEALEERTDAVMTYLTNSEKPVEEYFGRKMMAYLRGQKIVEELRGNYKILSTLQGNVYIQ